MKNIYILPAALMLLLVSCKSDKKEQDEATDPTKTDLYAHKLNGKVETIKERSFSYAGGTKGASAGETSVAFDFDLQFNDKGQQISEKKYNAAGIAQDNSFNGTKQPVKEIQYVNGKPGIITEYSYDKKGNQTSKTKRTGGNAQIDRIEMVYNGKNMVEKNTYNNQNTPIDKITYGYDKAGNVIEENIYMGTQSVKVQAVYEYEDNRKTGETWYNNSKLSHKTSYTYNGDKIESKITTNGNGGIEYTEKMTYDAKGNLLKLAQYEKATNIQSEEVNTYDDNNNLTSVIISSNNKLQHKELYAYDKNNNVVSVMATDATGKILTNRNYAYTYDAQNNWTKKIVNIMGEPAFIVERTITYHK